MAIEIPADRPVCGQDLDDVRKMLGLSVADACYLYGLSPTKWSQMVSGIQAIPEINYKGSTAQTPVTDPTLALLVRCLAANPELPVIPQMPSPAEMSAMISNVTGNPTQRYFAVALGNESTSAYRWSRIGQQPPATAQRLLYALKLALVKRDDADKKAFMANWEKIVRTEAAARDAAGDVFETGKWPQTESEQTIIKELKKKAEARKSGGKTAPKKRSKADA
jgi:hypothetical protein